VILAVVRSYIGVEWNEVELEQVVSLATDESEEDDECENDLFVDDESNFPATIAADYHRGMLATCNYATTSID
jgi:hypothetical protein